MTAVFATAAITTTVSAISASITPAPITAATAAAAGTRRPLFTRTGFIDGHGATIHLFAVERLDGGFGRFLGFHGDKPEPARPAAELVHDQVHFRDRAVGGKQIMELILSGVERKISDK